ncbi:hypothetical protein HKBW3S34_02146, partial [Candidatus Hakubella thermalkaliphila]
VFMGYLATMIYNIELHVLWYITIWF